MHDLRIGQFADVCLCVCVCVCERARARRRIDSVEVKSFSVLVEETSKKGESIGKLFDEAVRDQATIFRHNSGCSAQPGFCCNCLFAKLNFYEMSALDAASQSGLDGLNTKPTL